MKPKEEKVVRASAFKHVLFIKPVSARPRDPDCACATLWQDWKGGSHDAFFFIVRAAPADGGEGAVTDGDGGPALRGQGRDDGHDGRDGDPQSRQFP